MLHAMTESDDALKVAVDDATQWHLKYSQLLTRFNGLMHERNECVKMIKERQKTNKRLCATLRAVDPTRTEIWNEIQVKHIENPHGWTYSNSEED